MKTPLWMVNSLLVLLSLFVAGFIIYSQIQPPSRKQLEPDPSSIILPKKEISKVQLSRIYNNDLFNTYIPMPKPTVQPIQKPQIPAPPNPKQYTPAFESKPTFLDPLNIKLKGIIWQGTEEESRTIIADSSGKQTVYRVGDKLEDSHVLRIFDRKIILMRSNGQQEALYLSSTDAARDQEHEIIRKQDYSKVIQQINETVRIIDPEEFTKITHNLGQVIDALNLSSVYQSGEPIGIRIGSFEEETLGSALGLQEDDVIISINNIEATSIQKRLEIYNSITELPEGSVIRVLLLRDSDQIMHYYRLQKILQNFSAETTSKGLPVRVEKMGSQSLRQTPKPNQEKIINDSKKLTHARTEIKRNDKRAMLKKGSRQPLFKSIT